MVAGDPIQLGALLVLAAFVPPILYAIWIRNTERWHREPWGSVFRVFLYGSIWSILIALLLEAVFQTHFQREYFLIGIEGLSLPQEVLLAVIIAPVVEEFAKGLGIRSARRRILELEDGIVYGAAAGLGFSATENLFYELFALRESADYTFLAVAATRSFTSSFLHATASGILGYGMAKRYLEGGLFIEVLPYYALAVMLHAGFNGLATLVEAGGVPVGGVLLIFLVSILSIRWTVQRIRRLDRASRPSPYLYPPAR